MKNTAAQKKANPADQQACHERQNQENLMLGANERSWPYGPLRKLGTKPTKQNPH